jgi:hypothetical protein
MAVTRIKNNQITDATIVASSKLVDYSISAAKIANNLTYGSDLTITGNLTVQGNTTAIDTNITTIEDPVILLASTQTGNAAVDIGFIGQRGLQTNIAFVWDESQGVFVTAFTDTAETATTINITAYASTKVLNSEVTGNLAVTGQSNLANILVAANSTVSFGNNKISNVADPVGAQDAATKNYVDSELSSSAFSISDGVTTESIVGGDTIDFEGSTNITVAVASVTGNISSVTATLTNDVSISGNFSATGTITSNTTITGGNVATGGTVSATGNITGGNVATGGTVSSTGTATVGNLATGGTVSSTGNATVGNLATGGTVSATSTITGGNVSAGSGYISTTGNVNAGNVNTTSIVGATVTVTSAGTITFAGTQIDANSTKIINLGTPTAGTDAANKNYVDSVAQGLNIKASVRVATAAALPAYTYNNGTAGVGATITATAVGALVVDGQTLTVSGTRVLVKNEIGDVSGANSAYNGIYTLSTVGDGSTAFVLTRSLDMNVAAEFDGAFTFVSIGTVNADTGWVQTNEIATVGTTPVYWTQFSGAGEYTAGNGLTLTGTVFSVNVDEVTTTISGDNVIVKASAQFTTPNIGAATGTSLSVTGTIAADGTATVGNVATGGTVSATSTITGGNVATGGTVSATSTITGGNVATGGTVSSTGTATVGNLATGGTVSSTGNATVGNLATGGTVSSTGTATVGNLATGGTISATSTITSAATITGGNLATGGTISSTGTATVGNVDTSGAISATGNITGNNIVGTTSGKFGNIVISGDDITDTNGRVNFNTAGADVDFAVNGDTVANVFYVDAGSGTASFGSATQTTGAVLSLNAVTSFLVPVGNIGQRPTGVTGMLRFNSQENYMEVFDNTEWTAVAAPPITVITDDQFNGDGSTVSFTLSVASTTAGTIVAINGVQQLPTTAYAISGTTLTFTEAPASGDVIDSRVLTTTSSVTALQNGNSSVQIPSSAGNIITEVNGATIMTVSPGLVNIQGNLTVSGNATLSGNILGDRIQNGTTSLDIQSPGGNANISIGGTSNVAVFTTAGLNVTGVISATGNITGNFFQGNGSQLTGIDATSIQNGTSSLSVIASGGNIRGNIAGATVTTTHAGGLNLTGNLLLSGAIYDNGQLDIQTIAGNANIVLTPNGTGNVNFGSNIMPTANATANIGSATSSFNTIFAKATSAQYADLAEKYAADAAYAPGTVVSFGGNAEVTASTDADSRVAGVVSTNPSYIMNGGLQAEHVVTVALTGRVPTRVTGTVRKGDLMVSAGAGLARAEAAPAPGTIIGKALANHDGAEGVIEVVVGRF